MAKLGYTFKTEEVEDSPFELMPIGEYTAMITESELRQSRKGFEMLVLTFELQDDKFTGRKIISYLNVGHETESVQNMAMQDLKRICAALGMDKLDDTDDLHHKRMKIKVDVQKGKPYTDKETGEVREGYDNNTIKGYFSVNGSTSNASAASGDGSEPSAKKVPAWKQKG
tara:strand:- start:3130 stop:3639 length:510 start_codon:yes stop_codon:yes gene_type:complete